MPEVQVDAAHYGQSYHRRERYYSYVEQIMLVQELAPREVLEIGIGSGFVSRELRASGLVVTTMDLDPALGPDISGTIDALPFRDNAFDLVFCCQVLEHLPFDRFDSCLREIRRVTRRHAVISLPNVGRVLRVEFARGMNPGRGKQFVFSPAQLKSQAHVFNGQHYWEIGKRGYTPARIEESMRRAGFVVQRSYRLYTNPHHHFFVLEKCQ